MVGEARPERVIGRYALYDQIGAGGMATVHYGRLLGPAGFSKTVAIKRLHPHFARDPEFASMFLDEARLAARIHHPNVVATLDVVAKDSELFLVMEFVEGMSLAGVFYDTLRRGERMPVGVVGAVMQNVLAGLHAAHEATTEQGAPLELIHRDVSPQNVLLGRDGVARVLDFGIAKAIGRSHTTREGRIKGKLAYMPPEQIRGQPLDRRADLYAVGVMFWEILAGRRLYDEEDDAATIYKVVHEVPPQPRAFAPDLSPELDALIMRSIAKNRDERFSNGREMALAFARAMPCDSPLLVGDFLARLGHDTLLRIASKVREIESVSSEMQAESDTVPELDMGRISNRGDARASAPSARSSQGGASGRSGELDFDAPARAPVSGVAATVRASFPALDLPTHASRPAAASPVAPSPTESAPVGVNGNMVAGAAGSVNRFGAGAANPETQQIAPSKGLDVDLDLGQRDGRRGPPTRPQERDPERAHPALGAQAHHAASPRSAMGDRHAADARGSLGGSKKSGPPISLYATIGFVALGAIAASLYLFVFKKTPAPAPSSTAAAGLSGVEGACEASRKRMLRANEDAGPFDTRGWVVELWLSRDASTDLTPGDPALADVRGSDGLLPPKYGIAISAKDQGAVDITTLPAPPWRSGDESGVLLRLSGGYATMFFDPMSRGAFNSFADQLFEKTDAKIGALYARCKHLPFHDVGAWFRGSDLSVAGDALGFIMAGYAEGMWVTRSAFDGSGRAVTAFQGFEQHRMGVDGDAFKIQLRTLGASVEDTKKSATIIFPVANPVKPISAAQWLTQKSGL